MPTSTRKAKLVSINPEDEVSDPQTAAQLQLEILIQRSDVALQALKRGYKHEFQEQIKNMKHALIRVHTLTQLSGPYDDRRLVKAFQDAAADGSAIVSSDTSDGMINIQGNYSLRKLSRRFLW